MEWVFGITDRRPTKWHKCEPRWENETLLATSSHTFQQVMQTLSETALYKRRKVGGYAVNVHLWDLKIAPSEQVTTKKSSIPAFDMSTIVSISELEDMLNDGDNISEDKSGDDKENHNRRTVMVVKPDDMKEAKRANFHKYEIVSSFTKLSRRFLRKGHVVTVTCYDYGFTTNLYLKVLGRRPAGEDGPVRYLENSLIAGYQLSEERNLEAVPAFHLPPEKQIDAYYPNLSKAFLCQFVPIYHYEKTDCPACLDPANAIGSACLGLSERITTDDDTEFCFMENATCSKDLFFCSPPFEDMNEFFAVAEQAWSPRYQDNDPDCLDFYNYNDIFRHVFPADPKWDKAYHVLLKHQQEENYAQENSFKFLVFRKPPKDDETSSIDDGDSGRFDFAKVFPKTNAQLTSGKFRWFMYKNNILRVLVGRTRGNVEREFEAEQILRTWRRPFATFHELLCAVEASWSHNYLNIEFDENTTLPAFDADLGPSKPVPRDPPCLGDEGDAVVIFPGRDWKCFVTALAIVEENGKTILYSGHDNGILNKWSLVENERIWSKQIYADGTEVLGRSEDFECAFVQATMGVAGIAIRDDPDRPGNHFLYTWTHSYEGYPDVTFEKRRPSEIKVWKSKDCSFVKAYPCKIGKDKHGHPANPTISTVVFCPLYVKEKWVDAMMVGLHCLCPESAYWNSDNTIIDMYATSRLGKGNLLPFDLSTGLTMETWREHQGMIRAMAVIPPSYLLSYSIRPGHGLPDALVLWSLRDPGVPLVRHDFWDPGKPSMAQNRTRLDDVCGLAVWGNEVILCDNCGDRVAIVSVEDELEEPCIKLHGYASITNRREEDDFQGRMASCGKYAAMANECSPDVWIFSVKGNANYHRLDRREGPRRDYMDDGDEKDEETFRKKFVGREIAIGKVTFPFMNDSPPPLRVKMNARKKGEEKDENYGIGNGGPVSLAMRGRYLVAGFADGAIVMAPPLPTEFDSTQKYPGANLLIFVQRFPVTNGSCRCWIRNRKKTKVT